MAFTKPKKIISPVAVAAPWPKITVADEYQGVRAFKAGLILDPNDSGVQDYLDVIAEQAQISFVAAIAEIDEALESATGKKLATLKERKENMRKHVPVSDEYAEDGTITGRVIVKYKRNESGTYRSGKNAGQDWTATVPCFDASKKPLSESDGIIYGGSTLRIQAEVVPFSMAATSTAGVSLRMVAVQVIELVTGGDDTSGFDVEEGGYQASEVQRVVSKTEGIPFETADDSGDF